MLLFNGSRKQQFASSLAAALLLSGVGATFTGAQPLSDSADSSLGAESDTVNLANLAFDSAESSSAASQSTATTSIPTTHTLASIGTSNPGNSTISLPARTELEPSSLNDILIHAHTIDGRQAATLYVKNIPVLTFIGTEVSSLSNNSDVISLAASSDSLTLQTSTSSSASASSSLLDAENDPVSRATRLGKQLDSEGIDASEISVRWDEEREGYTVTLADQELIALDSRTILADTTDNEAEDALQVTNRLRRLIGGEEPVSEIEGLPAPEPAPPAPAQTVAISSSTVGGASWYGPGFHGRRSASGEVFNQNALTAAHKTLPFGTRVLVTNLNNGRQVTVRINDRGPYSGNRIIDLSAGAAAQIGLINSGVGTVRLDVLAN